MSLKRKKNGQYVIRYYASASKKSTQRQETLPLGTTYQEAVAKHKARVATAEARRGDETDDRLTIKALSDRYLELHGPQLAPASLGRTKEILRLHILPYIGEMRVTALKAYHVEQIRQKRLTAKANPSTVNREWNVLRALLNFGETKGIIERNPLRRDAIKRLKADEGRTVYFEPDEWQRFITAFDDEGAWKAHAGKVRRFGPVVGAGRKPENTIDHLNRLRAIVPVFKALLFTGSRLNEILSLRWRDVDLKQGTLTILQEKTRKAKTIPMADVLRVELEALSRGIGEAFVFTHGEGRPFYKLEVQRAFAVARGLAGIREELTPHTLRHTFASWLAMEGTALHTIQKLLGHANIQTTGRYAHLSPSHLAEATGIVGRIGSATPQKAARAARRGIFRGPKTCVTC
ncbi:MAG TPA: tyrosine-type recombinase/integrase [Thermoanaerobaculia bacterium]|nr:tyrosine-type recombinase/integrase [Thermoanaerobaculia bacterium]